MLATPRGGLALDFHRHWFRAHEACGHRHGAILMESEQSHRLALALTHRVGQDASAEQTGAGLVALCREISEALEPILGPRGVSALYQRSFDRTLAGFPWLAAAAEGLQTSLGVLALRPVLAQQGHEAAAAGAAAFLLAFHELLSSLVGLSLTEQLLQSILKDSSSGASAQDLLP